MPVTLNQRGYYEVLGVGRDADQKAIKDAFRNLALKYHPDRNKEPGAQERFKDIAEAYAILSDPKKRADYDARGFAGVAGFNREDLFGGINFDDIFGGLNFDFSSDSVFGDVFHRRPSGPVRGANMEVELSIPLERVVTGGEEELHLTRPVVCPGCHGTGEALGVESPKCETCAGTGRVTRSQRSDQGNVLIEHISTCPACEGRGRRLQQPCAQCQGGGQVEQSEVLKVVIPVGAEDGLVLRIPGKGLPSPDVRGVPGDLFAVVRTRPDARFERQGGDLVRRESVSLVDAVLGTTLTVPTLDGAVSVTVPPGTQPQAVLRLRKKGLPAYGGGPRGDLYLYIVVLIPERLTRQERELYGKLRALRAPAVVPP